MLRSIGILTLILILLTGCSNKREIEGNSIIDWSNFIQVEGIFYLAAYSKGIAEIDDSDIGEQYSKVKFKVADVVKNSAYQIQDGDAAILEKGTKIYKVNGYTPEFRLAVYDEDRIVLYEASRNPNAKTGEDILPIKGKVNYIDVELEGDDGFVKSYKIDDENTIDKIVDYLMVSEIDYNKSFTGGNKYFLYFHLVDGTTVRRIYLIQDDMINYGIIVPEEFKDYFLKALN